jgi:CRP-like cAMP-binding protein
MAQSPLWSRIFLRNKVKARPRLQFLKEIPLFHQLKEKTLQQISDLLHERSFVGGETIFEMDRPASAMFMIVKGRVEIYLPGDLAEDKAERHLATLGDGAFFGELALIFDAPRSASARALEDTKLLAYSRDDLQSLLEEDPVAAARIYESLACVIGIRLVNTNQLLPRDKHERAA